VWTEQSDLAIAKNQMGTKMQFSRAISKPFSHYVLATALAACGLFAFSTIAPAQITPGQTDDSAPLRKGVAAMGDFSSDAPGVRRVISVGDLPAPYATASARNMAFIVRRPDGALPKVPSGFTVDLLAAGLRNPRKIIAAPNGDIFVAESAGNRVSVLHPNADGTIAEKHVFAAGLRQPFGIAFYPPGPNPQYVYIANTDSVVRYPYQNGDTTARADQEMIVPDIPGGGRLTGGGHWTRDVVFSLDGSKMFVSVGSHSNVDDNPIAEKNRADILQYNPDGTGFRIFASGIRNAVGLVVDPQSGILWASVNERDELGDNVPPDYITHIQDNGFYGWPWYYIGNHQDPRHAGAHPELAEKVIVPDVLIQTHSASLCITFYEATQFPPKYRGFAFAAEHGSWNRSLRTGYKVICVPMKDGKSDGGEYDDFLTGFVTDSGDVWGRPVGVTVDSQGSLLVSDDGSNSIWRVRYTGAAGANQK
jgi:glucose/arabinose dehydrogenase